MNKTEKAESVAKIKELVSNATSIFLVDYHGVNVEDISEIRREFLKEGVTYKVFKNTLIKKALEETESHEKFNDLLVGMSGVAFAGENYVATAKVIKKYFDAKKKFSLKGCYIETEFIEGDKLNMIASMPTKDEIMSGIVRSVASPATGITGAVNAVMRDLASVVDEISKKKAA